MRTPNTTRVFTQDFADSPFRVAYVIADRAYVVVEVATGNELDWHDRYQAAYELVAALNTHAAAEAAEVTAQREQERASVRAQILADQARRDAEQVDALALEPQPAETVIINRPGLTWNAIRVTAQSTVTRGVQMVGSYQYEGVVVDNVFVALVRTAHVMSNPALSEALASVYDALQAAQARLRASHSPVTLGQYGQALSELAAEPPAGIAIPVQPRKPDSDGIFIPFGVYGIFIPFGVCCEPTNNEGDVCDTRFPLPADADTEAVYCPKCGSSAIAEVWTTLEAERQGLATLNARSDTCAMLAAESDALAAEVARLEAGLAGAGPDERALLAILRQTVQVAREAAQVNWGSRPVRASDDDADSAALLVLAPSPPDDDPPPPAAVALIPPEADDETSGGARVLWHWAGTAGALRQLLAAREVAA